MTPTTLDIEIALAPPPPDAPAGTLAAFTVSYLTIRAAGLLPTLLTRAEREELRWYLEDYWQWPYDAFRARGLAAEQLIEAAGRRLFDAVFGQAQAAYQPWNLDPRPSLRRQISVTIAPGTPPAALSLPWELLRDDRGYLALRTRSPVSIVRRMPEQSLDAFVQPFELPLRVLLVTSRPDDEGFIDPRGVARSLYTALEPQMAAGLVAVEILRPPTLLALRQRLAEAPPVHLLHFDGHGGFVGGRRADGSYGATGSLIFEDDDGKADAVDAADLAEVLQDSGVALAVLNACQSAQGDDDDAFSSAAARLVQSGVDGVVAMSASVLVAAATRYVAAFYQRLAGGDSVPLAHERARQELHARPQRHPQARSLDAPGEPVILRDWWLPHLYLQRELDLAATGAPVATAPPAPPLTDMPPPPRYGFGGRARELLRLERGLRQGKLVLVHGFGGQGKTALAAEAADWLTRTGMYAGALFVSYEHGGDAELLLSALGRHLGLEDGSLRADDPRAALATIKPLLRQRPTLIIADNLEAILPAGDAPLAAGERTVLWDSLLALRELGCGVILTSRDAGMGDGRLAEGRHVRHIALGGLAFADAYELVTRLMRDLDIAADRAPYVLLKKLLERLDNHPLAIQLVLPHLRTHPLAAIVNELSALLKEFVDDSATGRNASLLASLEYSLRRLTPAQRARLPRLAVFEGGAVEFQLLQITEIPEDEWAALRVAMEGAALLRAQPVAGWNVPFLQFHPILTPYLRTLPEANDETLQARFLARYQGLAGYLYHEDDRNPLAARALVRRELPNLRRAFDGLVAAADADAAAAMADSIGQFLANFGRGRELAELLRRVAGLGQAAGGLSQAEYLGELNQANAALARGELQAAYDRSQRLLARVEQLPAAAPRGPGSYAHSLVLAMLGRILHTGGRPAEAELTLRRALEVVAALIAAEPENKGYLRHTFVIQTELGDALTGLGSYTEAQQSYEEVIRIAQQLGDTRGAAVAAGQLGSLALRQRDYAEATRRHQQARQQFQELGEPAMEAVAWHQLGMVAQEQKQWAEAGRCYRESLAIRERIGNPGGAAQTCNQLAIVAKGAGRLDEAERWYRRAIELDEKLNNPHGIARGLNNLADLLLDQARGGRTERLAEARALAERSLALREQLDLSSAPWTAHYILAGIAELAGDSAAAQGQRRRERATFAAFAGNRWHIDQQHAALIRAAAAVAGGDQTQRAAIEEALPQLEANGWRIGAAMRQIWAGARDWQAICEAEGNIDANSALLILRVLEEAGSRSSG